MSSASICPRHLIIFLQGVIEREFIKAKLPFKMSSWIAAVQQRISPFGFTSSHVHALMEQLGLILAAVDTPSKKGKKKTTEVNICLYVRASPTELTAQVSHSDREALLQALELLSKHFDFLFGGSGALVAPLVEVDDMEVLMHHVHVQSLHLCFCCQ